MKALLIALFALVTASMLAVTSWASVQCPLFGVPKAVYQHPWFLATMADAYWGFVTFYVWVAYKQTSWVARGAWALAILSLGNIAMSSYCLAELILLPKGSKVSQLLSERRDGPGPLGITLAALGVAVTLLGYVTS